MSEINNNHHQKSEAQSQASHNQSEQMQIDYSSVAESEGISSIPKEFSISEIKIMVEEEEQNYRMDLMEKETKYLEKLYEDQKKGFEDFMKCENSEERDNWLKEQFIMVNEYTVSMQRDYNAIRERLISHEMSLLSIRKQDEEIARLSKEIKEKEERYNKRETEKAKKDALLVKIRKEKEEVKSDIVLYKKRIETGREKKIKFDELQAKLKEKENEKLEREQRTEELKKKLMAVDEARNTKKEKHEAEMYEKKWRNDKLKLEIDQKKKRAKEVKEMQELLKTLEQQENMESNNRQKQQVEQRTELRKEAAQLKNIEEKFESNRTKYEEFCKANNIEFVSFIGLETRQIQESLENYQQIVRDKKIEVENSEKELERLQQNQEYEIQTKKKKLEEAKNLLEVEKLKHKEKKEFLAELDQKVVASCKRIDEQNQEKQENLVRKEKALAHKKELDNKIKELNIKIAEENKNIAMAESMNQDVLEVNKHINKALKDKEILQAEVAQFEKEHATKLAAIENRIVEKSKAYQKNILELESEIEKNAKIFAQKKREGTKRDNKKMQRERNLREKLSKLKMDIAEIDKKSETVSSIIEVKTDQTPKSILKSPLLERTTRNQSTSPKKVKFDVESENSSSLSQMPLTQKPSESQ